MGEQTRNPAGVVLGWNLIVHDLASQMGATPMLGVMLSLIFEDCMTAIIDDPQFLADVLEFARQAQMI